MAMTKSDTLNYRGSLMLYGAFNAPFLASIASRAKRSSTFTYPIAVPYTLTGASQDTQSEDTATAAGTPTTVATGQDVNVAQIMKYDVSVSFKKQSVVGQFSGTNDDNPNPILNPLQFQMKAGLMQIAANMEYTLCQGSYVAESATSTNTKTRGLKNAITTNTVAASSARLSKDMLEALVAKMVASGTPFVDVVCLCNVFQLQVLSDIFGFAPPDRSTGGVFIKQLMIPGAGNSGLITAFFSPQMPTDEVYLVERSVCAPVFVPVIPFQDGNVAPQQNNINGVDVMYQPVGITAAAGGGFLYTQFGFDYGTQRWHGSVTGLATS